MFSGPTFNKYTIYRILWYLFNLINSVNFSSKTVAGTCSFKYIFFLKRGRHRITGEWRIAQVSHCRQQMLAGLLKLKNIKLGLRQTVKYRYSSVLLIVCITPLGICYFKSTVNTKARTGLLA